MKSRTFWIVGLSLSVVVGMIGCSSNPKVETEPASAPSAALSQPASSSTVTGQPTPQPLLAAAPAEASNEPIEMAIPAAPTESAPGSVELELDVALPALEGVFANASAALATLRSYRYTTTFSFIGEEGGDVESGSIEVHGVVAAADRQQMTWVDLSDGSQFGLVRVGDRAWIRDEDEWNEVPTLVADAASQAVLIYAPAMSWAGFAEGLETTASYVGTEVVNGIPARHYASTYQGWAGMWQGEVADASADVWIADAGYPVRYRFAASGVDEEGRHGAVTWSMDLTDVNTPITVEPPQ